MFGDADAVVGEYQFAASVANFVGEDFDGGVALRVVVDLADIDGADAIRMFLDDLGIDLGIALAAVTDQDERQRLVECEHVVDDIGLVVLCLARPRAFEGQPPFAQEQDWPHRDAIHVEEHLEHFVDRPGPTGDVQHWPFAIALRATVERTI